MAYTHTDKTLEELPERNKKFIGNLPVASDCVETLEEIKIQGKESFIGKGGKTLI